MDVVVISLKGHVCNLRLSEYVIIEYMGIEVCLLETFIGSSNIIWICDMETVISSLVLLIFYEVVISVY